MRRSHVSTDCRLFGLSVSLALALGGCGALSSGSDPVMGAGVPAPIVARSAVQASIASGPRLERLTIAAAQVSEREQRRTVNVADVTVGASACERETVADVDAATTISASPPTTGSEQDLRIDDSERVLRVPRGTAFDDSPSTPGLEHGLGFDLSPLTWGSEGVLESGPPAPRIDRAMDFTEWPAAQPRAAGTTDGLEEEYDPWEAFNEKMFTFNRNLDRFVLKPAARVYRVAMPEPFQLLIENGFDNIRFVPRLISSALQGKWGGAGRELARFLINSTAGIGGLFDPAKNYWGIEKSREDFGQTLGVWGSGPGPFLILPFLPPLTVRDGIGMAVDGALDPLSYVLPFFWDRLGMKLGDTLNDRAINYDLFQGFEESVIDMYSAVRHGYLRRREQLIKE